MTKKEIKEKIKQHQSVASENAQDLNTLEVLLPRAPSCDVDVLPSQAALKNVVNMYTSEKAIDLKMDSPCVAQYTVNGSHMLLATQKGCVSAFDTHQLSQAFERTVDDTIFDAAWLHNEQYFALAQREALYIYDANGIELHAVRDVSRPQMLAFLPYHFLLAATTSTGRLKYLDTTQGALVADLSLTDKKVTCLGVNPSNAVLYAGSANGTASLWVPSQEKPVMDIYCSSAAVTGIGFDRRNETMVTSSIDGKYSLFDVRSVYKPLRVINAGRPIHGLAVSQNRVTCLATGKHLMLYRDLETPIGSIRAKGYVESLAFCPHEDILTAGNSSGMTSYIVPGSGDPHYDASEVSPFMNPRQRKQKEVQQLLDKIPYDLISHDQMLGQLVPKEPAAPRGEKKARYFDKSNENTDALSRFRRTE
ncbi:U3 small nucleolar RNA-associated protein 7 [Pancytospora philotis]|nr:U3 small nucleolar RNA-associated protein 7 [Pancytospora philotis]